MQKYDFMDEHIMDDQSFICYYYFNSDSELTLILIVRKCNGFDAF